MPKIISGEGNITSKDILKRNDLIVSAFSIKFKHFSDLENLTLQKMAF